MLTAPPLPTESNASPSQLDNCVRLEGVPVLVVVVIRQPSKRKREQRRRDKIVTRARENSSEFAITPRNDNILHAYSVRDSNKRRNIVRDASARALYTRRENTVYTVARPKRLICLPRNAVRVARVNNNTAVSVAAEPEGM